MHTSEQLRAARAALQLTRTELAALADVSPETIKKLESLNGELQGTVRILNKIKAAFETKGVIFIAQKGGPPGIGYTPKSTD